MEAHQVIAEANRSGARRRAGIKDRSREPLLGPPADMAISRVLLTERADIDPKEADRLAVKIADAVAKLPVPVLGPDHRQRAIDFHRRAQAAEGAEIRVRHEAMFWHDAWRRVASSRRTLKRKLNRARAQLRAARWTDPLTRIIELGRLFP